MSPPFRAECQFRRRCGWTYLVDHGIGDQAGEQAGRRAVEFEEVGVAQLLHVHQGTGAAHQREGAEMDDRGGGLRRFEIG